MKLFIGYARMTTCMKDMFITVGVFLNFFFFTPRQKEERADYDGDVDGDDDTVVVCEERRADWK